MQGLFSKRFSKALRDKSIPYPSFSRTLRKRLAMICSDYSEQSYTRGQYTNTSEETIEALKKAYGQDALHVQDEASNGSRKATGLTDFIVYSYPHSVLDALEAFYRLAEDENKALFQAEANAILEEEESPWRMSDGRAYMIDSRFLSALKDQTEEEMKREGFLGAQEEFKDARSCLQAGESDDAINKANRAFESALKSLLNQREGSATDLLKKLLQETALLKSIPDDVQKAIVLKVLQGLPVLRNKIGSHGQGSEVIDIPRAYGDLAVNLSATYIKFLLDLKKELAPHKDKQDECFDEDDLPF